MGYHELKDFVDNEELTTTLVKLVCSPCDVDDCQDCPGLGIIDEIVDQVCDAGIEHMKIITKEWGES